MAEQTEGVLVGGGGGALTGAATGAMIGSVVPGVGTLAGALVGGALGAAGGGLSGALGGKSAKKARKAAEAARRAAEEEQRRRAANAGQARDIFGQLPAAGENYRDLKKTLQNRSVFGGLIDQQVAGVQAEGMQGLAEQAQQAAVAGRGAAAQSGMIGSSIDAANRRAVLGSYLGGRAGVGAAAQATREGAWGGLEQQAAGMANMARQGGSIIPGMAGRAALGQVQSARAQIPGAVFGNLLATGGEMARQAAVAQEQGGQGFGAYGLPRFRLPGLGGGTSTGDRPVGGYISRK